MSHFNRKRDQNPITRVQKGIEKTVSFNFITSLKIWDQFFIVFKKNAKFRPGFMFYNQTENYHTGTAMQQVKFVNLSRRLTKLVAR